MTEDLLKPLNACVIIPTFNNVGTLARVLDKTLHFTKDIIVVNDGSTDTTLDVLAKYSSENKIDLISLSKNQGKGTALKSGFQHAHQAGFQYAICIDSDGQHFPEDLPSFVQEIQENGPALLIGSRDMNQENVPSGSSFGNRFSNFWYWAETGIRLSDTQSGFRLYPLKKLYPFRFFTKKFEFEIEVIVKAAWKGIPVKNIPIQVLYDPIERVTHFRPFRDFARISLLNCWLMLLATVYYHPRNFLRKLFL